MVDAGIDGALAEAFRQLGVGEANAGLEPEQDGENRLTCINNSLEALVEGPTFVARPFTGYPKYLSILHKAAPAHKGTVVLSGISPCVTFNYKDESPKSST